MHVCPQASFDAAVDCRHTRQQEHNSKSGLSLSCFSNAEKQTKVES